MGVECHFSLPLTIVIKKWQNRFMKSAVKKIKKEEPLTMTIDKFGRVVIPQEVREVLGLVPGTTLKIDKETPDSIVLKIVREEAELVWKNGILVIRSKGPPLDFDIVESIKQDREERARKIWGDS